MLDDLVTTGGSKLEALAPLLDAGLKVKDVVVLVDREQGGKAELAAARPRAARRSHAEPDPGLPGPSRPDQRLGTHGCARGLGDPLTFPA